MAAVNTAAVAFVELPSADRKPPRQRGGFFYWIAAATAKPRKRSMPGFIPSTKRRPSGPLSAPSIVARLSAKNAERVQHSEGQKYHHQNAGDHRVGAASSFLRRRHEFQAPCIRCTTRARAERMPCGDGAAHPPGLQCRYAWNGSGFSRPRSGWTAAPATSGPVRSNGFSPAGNYLGWKTCSRSAGRRPEA